MYVTIIDLQIYIYIYIYIYICMYRFIDLYVCIHYTTVRLPRREDDALSYILCADGMDLGTQVECGEEAPVAPGNAMKLRFIPDGTRIHNIEMNPGLGGKM